eukprot:gb/GEZN01004227.1/.p1 GENE.gb/GEZN01004227.1/~~gb/GEZN01004227.1/.p1  ORF type:complete len:481 (+),score=59.77 gb/GEZN01004227.1/:26-1468(+)
MWSSSAKAVLLLLLCFLANAKKKLTPMEALFQLKNEDTILKKIDFSERDLSDYSDLLTLSFEEFFVDADRWTADESNLVRMTDATYLHAAAFRGFKRVVSKLVELGADINSRAMEIEGPLLLLGITPLMLAAHRGDVDMVRHLLKLGANPSLWEREKQMDALTVAVLAEDEEMVQTMLDGGCAVTQAQRWRTCDFMRKGPEDTCKARAMGAIHFAAINGQIDIINMLLAAGEDVNTFAGSDSDTPLHAAAMYGNLETVQYLVQHGADVTLRTGDDSLPIDVADAFDQQDVVTYLLRQNSPLPRKMGEKISYPEPVAGLPLRQHNVERVPCPQVTVCDLCRYTRDTREETINQACVWTDAGCRASSEIESSTPTYSECPVYPERYDLQANCFEVAICHDCVLTHHNDSNSTYYSACVWALHRSACYPFKYVAMLGYEYREDQCKDHWVTKPGQLSQPQPMLRIEADGVGLAVGGAADHEEL